jgi:hypothetical protein
MFTACHRKIYGIYDSSYLPDKSAYLGIKLNKNKTVQKVEIHTIRIESTGRFNVNNNEVLCYFDSTNTGFPPDTLNLQIRGRRMYFINIKKSNEGFYLLKKINWISYRQVIFLCKLTHYNIQKFLNRNDDYSRCI